MDDETEARLAAQATRVAIEIVTACLPYFWDRSDPPSRAHAYAHAQFVLAAEGAETIVMGQLTLIMILLTKLGNERGASVDNMADKVAELLQEISRELPA